MIWFHFREFCFKVFLFLIFCFGEANFAFSETIILKDGSTVEGKVIKKTDKEIVVDLLGVELTYYMDDIKTIEENVLVSTAKQAVPSKNAMWDNWYSGSVRNYIQSVLEIASRAREIVERFQKDSSGITKEMASAGQSLLDRSVALKPPAELESFHAQFIESGKDGVMAGEKIQGGDVAEGKTYQRKSFELMVSSMQELKRVCQLHSVPEEFISGIEKGNSFSNQQLQQL